MTIDAVVAKTGARKPFLLNLDVQGPELDASRGAQRSLPECELVVLEVSFFKFFQNGPDCVDVILFMQKRGFVPYDIVGLQYRHLDQALSQPDVMFVKEQGLFRRQDFYATPAQRPTQNQQIERHLDELFQRKSHA